MYIHGKILKGPTIFFLEILVSDETTDKHSFRIHKTL